MKQIDLEDYYMDLEEIENSEFDIDAKIVTKFKQKINKEKKNLEKNKHDDE